MRIASFSLNSKSVNGYWMLVLAAAAVWVEVADDEGPDWLVTEVFWVLGVADVLALGEVAVVCTIVAPPWGATTASKR